MITILTIMLIYVTFSDGNSDNSEPASTFYESEKSESSSDKIVYIGKSGNKYHKKDCITLHETKIAITLQEAEKQGKEPCKVCQS